MRVSEAHFINTLRYMHGVASSFGEVRGIYRSMAILRSAGDERNHVSAGLPFPDVLRPAGATAAEVIESMSINDIEDGDVRRNIVDFVYWFLVDNDEVRADEGSQIMLCDLEVILRNQLLLNGTSLDDGIPVGVYIDACKRANLEFEPFAERDGVKIDMPCISGVRMVKAYLGIPLSLVGLQRLAVKRRRRLDGTAEEVFVPTRHRVTPRLRRRLFEDVEEAADAAMNDTTATIVSPGDANFSGSAVPGAVTGRRLRVPQVHRRLERDAVVSSSDDESFTSHTLVAQADGSSPSTASTI